MAAEYKRTFSAAGNIITIQRTRLATDSISAAQIMRSWLKAGLLNNYNRIIFQESKINAMVDKLSYNQKAKDDFGWPNNK